MKTNLHKKTDRRTRYTIQILKDAFLTVKINKNFKDITVTDICREAEVSRGTFYLHFNNISEILDIVLDDAFLCIHDLNTQMFSCALSQDENKKNCFCRFIRNNKKYHGIFLDESLLPQILKKAESLYIMDFIKNFPGKNNLTENKIKNLFYFQINGCLALIKHNIYESSENWNETQLVIDSFIKNGLMGFHI